jgi:hypothetical protein
MFGKKIMALSGFTFKTKKDYFELLPVLSDPKTNLKLFC